MFGLAHIFVPLRDFEITTADFTRLYAERIMADEVVRVTNDDLGQ